MPESAAPPKPKRLRRTKPATPPATPVEQSSILRDAGAAAMTGLHTVGSILSTPSRLLWGTANALAGGEGGFGNLNPLDSTGGIELSKFLANQGVIAQNDPTKWEWGDVGRGLLDIAGDPLSYVAPLALTKAGQAASKGVQGAGKLAATIPEQIATGQRALLGLQLPLSSKATGVLGKGPAAAKVASTVGKGLKRVIDTPIPGTKNYPLRWLGSRFSNTMKGMRTPETQEFAPEFSQKLLDERRGNASLGQGIAQTWNKAGVSDAQSVAAMTMAAEQGRVIEVPIHSSATDEGLVNIFGGASNEEVIKQFGEQGLKVKPMRWRDTGRDSVDLIDKEFSIIYDSAVPNTPYTLMRKDASGADQIVDYFDSSSAAKYAAQRTILRDIAEGSSFDLTTDAVMREPVPKSTTRLLTSDMPEYWDHLDPTGGLKTVVDAFRADFDANDIRGIGPGALKDVAPGNVPEDPVAAYMHAALSGGIELTEDRIEEIAKRAPKLAEELSEVPVTAEYIARHMTKRLAKDLDRGAYSSGPEAVSAAVASDLGRQEMLKGIYGGRGMVDAILKDPDADKLIREIAAEEATGQPELRAQIAEALAAGDEATAQALSSQIITREVAIGRVANALNEKFGQYVTPMFKDVRQGGVERPRLRAIAEWMINHPEIRTKGVFGTDVLGDMWRHMDNSALARNNFDFTEAVIQKHAKLGKAIDRPDVADPNFEKVGALLGSMGVNVEKAAKYLGGRMGLDAGEIKEMTLPRHIADDLRQFKDTFRPVRPAELGRNAFTKFMSAWKAGALSWPRRITRDRGSGWYRNMENGWVSPWNLKPTMDADHLTFGRTLRGYKDLPAVQQWFAENGIDAATATDEDATEAIRRMFGAYMAQSPGIYTDVSELGEIPGVESGIEYLLKSMPGVLPKSKSHLESIRQGFGDLFTGLKDPLGIPGVRDIPEATFGPVKVAQRASEYTDYSNRAEAFLGQLLQGESDLPGIFNRIDAAQVSYDPRRSAPIDKMARTLFPFWRFHSQQLPYVLSTLVMHPGGLMGQTIKTVDRSQQGQPNLPESVLSGTAIPLGQDETGTRSYLTGLGMMHEPGAELLGQAASGDVPGIGYNLLAGLNPVLQKPLELTTGQSFFREGEKLTDLDPTVGRIASNTLESLGLRDAEQGPVVFPGAQSLDFAISALPGAGSLATQVRTAVDPRRSLLGKAGQLTTGVRVLKQSPQAQRKVLRRRLDELAEAEGARVGSHGPYATPAALEANPRLKQIIAVRRQLDREAQRDRRKKLKKEPAASR